MSHNLARYLQLDSLVSSVDKCDVSRDTLRQELSPCLTQRLIISSVQASIYSPRHNT